MSMIKASIFQMVRNVNRNFTGSPLVFGACNFKFKAKASDNSHFETRHRGIEACVIQTEDQMLLAQRSIANLRTVLLEARKVHSQLDYTRLAEPILLEIQQRQQEIFDYLSGEFEQRAAS